MITVNYTLRLHNTVFMMLIRVLSRNLVLGEKLVSEDLVGEWRLNSDRSMFDHHSPKHSLFSYRRFGGEVERFGWEVGLLGGETSPAPPSLE